MPITSNEVTEGDIVGWRDRHERDAPMYEGVVLASTKNHILVHYGANSPFFARYGYENYSWVSAQWKQMQLLNFQEITRTPIERKIRYLWNKSNYVKKFPQFAY